MISKVLIVLIAFYVFIAQADVINHPITGDQVRANCETYDISIRPDSAFQKNVTLVNKIAEPAGYNAIKPFKSPYGKSYFKIVNPDFMVAPKQVIGWTSSIYVKHIKGYEFEVTIKEHNNQGVTAYWRDNNTIIIETWWGRVAQSIFRLELSNELRMIAEDRGHFEAILPCYIEGS